MPRALIGLCLLLPGIPARYTANAVSLRATAPLPPLRVPVELSVEGHGAVGEGIWLMDDGRIHLAVRNALGQPVSILRVAHGVAALEFVGERQLVAADAGVAMLEASIGRVDPGDLGRLALGSLPRAVRGVEPFRHKWAVSDGPFHAVLSRDGRVESASVPGVVELVRVGDQIRLDFDQGLRLRVDLGEVEVLESVPDAAFAFDREVPSESTRRFAARAARRVVLGI